MVVWVNNPCTQEFLKILGWELSSLKHELAFYSDDELSTLLKYKGKILEVYKIIGIIEGLAKEPEKEEEAVDENSSTV